MQAKHPHRRLFIAAVLAGGSTVPSGDAHAQAVPSPTAQDQGPATAAPPEAQTPQQRLEEAVRNYQLGRRDDGAIAVERFGEGLGVEPPSGLDDLIEPDYADLLVVQNPATSSPGLAFLLLGLASITLAASNNPFLVMLGAS